MQIETSKVAGRPVHHLAGNLTFDEHQSLRACLERAAAGGSAVVELSGVTRADATGFGFLLLLAERLAGDGGPVEVRGAHGEVRRFLDLARLDRMAPLRIAD